jgi:hypothetical protein
MSDADADIDAEFVEVALRTTAAELFAGGAEVTHATLLDLGWEDLLATEPRAAVTVLAEVQGAQLGRSRLVELVMASALGLDLGSVWLGFPLGGPVASGALDAVVLGEDLTGATILVPSIGPGGVVLCPVAAEEVDVEVVGGIDPSLSWSRLRGLLPEPEVAHGVAADAWARALAAGSLALAHELIGVAQGLLDLAVDHVQSRVQFGVPIGTFQAVQHRLADVHVHIEAARAVAGTAWTGGRPVHATAALSAARTATTVATQHCHQVLGAMGCTWEHAAHRSIRRGIALHTLLDPRRELRALARSVAVSTDRVEVLA